MKILKYFFISYIAIALCFIGTVFFLEEVIRPVGYHLSNQSPFFIVIIPFFSIFISLFLYYKNKKIRFILFLFLALLLLIVSILFLPPKKMIPDNCVFCSLYASGYDSVTKKPTYEKEGIIQKCTGIQVSKPNAITATGEYKCYGIIKSETYQVKQIAH